MNTEELNEFVKTVKAMRAAQRKYFNTRSEEVLKTSKALEQKVDAMLAGQKRLAFA